ncbi:hypothetical protein AB0B06_37015, partial [Streptomyces sp. NPDC044989]|uniref:hypothetical protein n=1 Tax=Streptomyces sp. NPDC044989 TaxID=3154336 RepID=UPI0033F19228
MWLPFVGEWLTPGDRATRARETERPSPPGPAKGPRRRPRRARGRGSRALRRGIWAMVSAVATALGPIVGGLLVEHVDWESVF